MDLKVTWTYDYTLNGRRHIKNVSVEGWEIFSHARTDTYHCHCIFLIRSCLLVALPHSI